MNIEVEELLRDGMERFTAEVRAPPGWPAGQPGCGGGGAVRAAVACGAVAATAAAVVVATAAAGGPPRGQGSGLAQARETAYVATRVENALAGRAPGLPRITMSTGGKTSMTWGYGPRTGSRSSPGTLAVTPYPSGNCTHRRGVRALPRPGTALSGEAHRRLRDLLRSRVQPVAVCATRRTAPPDERAIAMGGPPGRWRRLAGLHRGDARFGRHVTGHARIDGVETTKITGMPVTVRLSRGYAKVVREEWLAARWTLYVNPKTYLPVRIYGRPRRSAAPGGSTPCSRP